ncbi:MAG: benzoate-CoA ligase family protein [Acidimicrobiia bacterium]|nr:benzoate-CoA ligase family protein [Acidimicrobiia bacterium]
MTRPARLGNKDRIAAVTARVDSVPEWVNIADAFLADRIACGGGDRIALRLPDRTQTYNQVERLAGGYAAALRELGVHREDRVVLLLDDGTDFVGALFGALKLAAVVVMVNPELAADRIAEILDLAQPQAVVHQDRLDKVVAGAVAASSAVPALLSVPATGLEVDASVSAAPTHRDDPALWLFSGGTTGVPKAVVQTHGSFLNTTLRYAQETLGYTADDITVSVPKLIFGYATGSNLFFPFSVGASAVLFPEPTTVASLTAHIARHRPTILITVPTMMGRMLADPVARRADLSGIRFATSAGEALPVELYHRWKDTYGVELLDGLGTAEMWHIFVSNRLGDVRPGTLGKPVAGFEVRVCDDDGNPVPTGDIGRLWVRGGSRAWGYWRDLPRTMETFRGEWVAGSDLVRYDEDGYLEHHGRADEALKVSGRWLAPQEVESCLLSHEAVAQCVVVGVGDATGLVKPVAFVIPAQPRPGLEAELIDHVLARLEPYKHPRQVVLVDDFPRTHLGKIDRAALRAQIKKL